MQVLVSQIQVGQKIAYTGDMCNSYGVGAVVAVNENKPIGQMYSMNFGPGPGLVKVDSSKTFDVALEDGRFIRAIYVSSIGDGGGCRFKLMDGVIDAEAVAGLMAGVALKKAADQAKALAEKAAFDAEKAKALAAGLALGLIPEDVFNKSGKRGSAAAFNLRAELKSAGIKARVKQDGYSSIDIYVAAEKDLKDAQAIGEKYKAGDFDGMTDCYDYSPGAWGSVFGDVQYVFSRLD